MSLPSFRDLLVLRRALWDRETPRRALLPALGALAYLIFPLDLIPDGILGLGQLDDLAMIGGLLLMSWKMVPEAVRRRASERISNTRKEKTPPPGNDKP